MQPLNIPSALLDEFTERQQSRLTHHLRASLPVGALVSLVFIPWNRWRDPTGELPAIEIGVALAAGMMLLMAMTYFNPSKPMLDVMTFTGCFYALSLVSLTLARLPNGFIYGVGTLLALIVVITVLAVDLSRIVAVLIGLCFLMVPNLSMLLAGSPHETMVNTNWILIPGVLVAFGLAYVMDRSSRNAFMLEVQLEEEKERSEALLNTLLPSRVAEELKQRDTYVAEIVPDAAVLFADLAGFTPLSRRLAAEELIGMLTDVFTALDEITARHGLEKIKTIGDAYMVGAGVADAAHCTVDDVAAFAIEAQVAVADFAATSGYPLGLRVGICRGPVVSGVIGRRKPHYDLWGTTVNLASRLESTAPIGSIQVDAETARHLSDRFKLDHRGGIVIDGIGTISTYLLLEHRRDEVAVLDRQPVLN